MWEKPICNNCGNKTHKLFLSDITTWEYSGRFSIVECEKCQLKYLSPRPKSKFIGKYYQNEGYWGTDLLDYESKDRDAVLLRKNQYRNIYKEILSRKKTGAIFDVGAGTGIFLTKFQDLDWKVKGVELSSDAVKFAQKVYKISSKQGDFDKLVLLREKFDVITFNSSLEHLYDPKKALKKAHKMLKRRGLIVVTVPNIESLGQLIFKKRWLPLHPPKHLYHFSDKILTKMLKNAGFGNIKVSHWCFHHAYYGIFQSMRYSLSPKFSKNVDGGSTKKARDLYKKTNTPSLKNEIGKKVVHVVTFLIVIIGMLIKRGETITIYAKKP